MDVAAMLEPVHSAPYTMSSSSVSSSPQQRLPSSILTSESEQHKQPSQRYTQSVKRPLPSLSSLSSMASLPAPSPQTQTQRVDSISSATSSVHGPIEQTPLPMQSYQHQRQHSNENSMRSYSSASSSQTGAIPRHRGKQTKAACIPCRKRKSKCDGVRPSCKTCLGKVTACEYSVNPGVTQQQAVKKQLDAYKYVLNLLRQGSVAECDVLVKQLKTQEDLAGAVGYIIDDRTRGVQERIAPPPPPSKIQPANKKFIRN